MESSFTSSFNNENIILSPMSFKKTIAHDVLVPLGCPLSSSFRIPFSALSLYRFIIGSSSVIPGRFPIPNGRFTLLITKLTAALVAAGDRTPRGDVSGVRVVSRGWERM